MSDGHMDFEGLVKEYLQDLQSTYRIALDTGEATPELSFRPPLHRFFERLPQVIDVTNVGVIFEPRRQAKAGRPDWRFHDSNSMGIFGYVEAKPFDPNIVIDPSRYREQINLYLSLGYKVILSDGIDFVFFDPDQPERLTLRSLVAKPLSLRFPWRNSQINTDLQVNFSNFFQAPSPRILSDSQIIRAMALRAKKISEDILELISLDEGSGIDDEENRNIEALHGLKELLTTGHDPDLCDNRKFADMVSQVLVFGLLYAHRHLVSTTQDTAELSRSLHHFWIEAIRQDGANRLRPFRALAESLSTEEMGLGLLMTWYSDCVLFLSHVFLQNEQQHSVNYHSLYEQFLSAYDPQVRIDFGAYATPEPLVRYVVAFSDWIARTKFNHRSLFIYGNKIIDPCCGTGTFLEEVLHALPPQTIRERRFPTMAGFEILPAPYALSQYRLALLASEGVAAADEVKVVMCNTLSDAIIDSVLPEPPSSGPTAARQLFQSEREEAVTLATPPITAIIGNPPSSDAGRHIDRRTHKRIYELMEEFRPPQVQRSLRQNVQKQVQNDFLKFVRWACHKLPLGEPGILAFVVPSSFLKHVSYDNARQWLFNNFTWIWALEFDSDSRTGIRVSNLFPTRQGRALIFCARENQTDGNPEVKCLSILNLDSSAKVEFFQQKTDELNSNAGQGDGDFETLEVTPPNYKFRPSIPFEQEIYERFWQLCPHGQTPSLGERVIFLRHCSGVKLGITAALVHVDQSILLRRLRDTGNVNMPFGTLIERWFRGQRKPPQEDSLNITIRHEIGVHIGSRGARQYLRPYSFRPFSPAYVFLCTPILTRLAGMGGGGSRSRPEILAAYSLDGNFGFSVAPAPEDIGESIHRFSSFAWHIPDNDLCTRGNAHVFCLYFPEYRRPHRQWDDRPRLNISGELLQSLGHVESNRETLAKKILFYSYGILCSNAYLDRFEGALFHTAGEWPRIPITQYNSLFERLVDLGERLARLENFDSEIDADEEIINALSPIRNREMDIRGIEIDLNAATLVVETTEGGEYVIDGIGREILDYDIAGYSVLKEWFKWRTRPYLRRTFRDEDALSLGNVITRIHRQFDIIRLIDITVNEILSNLNILI
ncbi:MAG: hypothetical protein FJ134_04350 [Deltaproteobacteria bacterium]|nr:hypothetical protein [Deltaproteobacteria bacterium]